MTTKSDKPRSRKLKPGRVYEVKSFAGVNVHMKVLKLDNEKLGIYMGTLVRKIDLDSLIKAGVPYSKDDNPEDCKSVIYDWQVVKEIRSGEKRSGKNSRNKRGKGRNGRDRGKDITQVQTVVYKKRRPKKVEPEKISKKIS
jgi:hypothetical protein